MPVLSQDGYILGDEVDAQKPRACVRRRAEKACKRGFLAAAAGLESRVCGVWSGSWAIDQLGAESNRTDVCVRGRGRGRCVRVTYARGPLDADRLPTSIDLLHATTSS